MDGNKSTTTRAGITARVAVGHSDQDLGADAYCVADEDVLGEAARLPEVEVEVRPEASLVHLPAHLLAQAPRGLHGEERDWTTVCHRPVRAVQRWSMRILGPDAQHAEEPRVADRQHLA